MAALELAKLHIGAGAILIHRGHAVPHGLRIIGVRDLTTQVVTESSPLKEGLPIVLLRG